MTLKVSVSSLDTYESCPRKYKFQNIDKLPRKSWEHLDVGNYVHEVLEKFHKELNADASRQPEELLKGLAKETWNKYAAKISAEGQDKSKTLLKAYLSYLNIDGWPSVLATEDKFSIEINQELTIRGVVDRIDSTGDGYRILDYKGLALDTPIPTPEGWTTMADLKVGDHVFGSDGGPVRVVLKSDIHNRPCYRVTLSDASSVVCDNVHLWGINVVDDGKLSRDICIDADQLFALIQGGGDIFIKNPRPLLFSEKSLPIDPWLLGAWLADGDSSNTSFNFKDERITDANRILSIYLADIKDADIMGYNAAFHALLRSNGLLKNKHIPQAYLCSSYDQRLALLQGLMDSNGHYDDLRTTAIFETNHSDFATAFASLVRTFGINTTVTEQYHNSSLKKYAIEFVPAGIAAFKIKNKIISASDILDGVAAALRYSHRKIVKMEQVPSVPTQCIGVDAPDSLYVGGEAMTCLHNTGQSKYLDKFQLQVYGMHLKNMFPDLKEYEGVYLVLPEGPKKLSYKITLDDIDAAKEDIIKTAEKIATDRTWEPKPTFLCKYCDYYDACPDGWGKSGRSEQDLVKISGRKKF